MSFIYLHFLDRELRASMPWLPKDSFLYDITTTLILCTHDTFLCGLSLICETGFSYQPLRRILEELISVGRLQVISNHGSVEEFIVSRQLLYDHDKDRYPMYFLPEVTEAVAQAQYPLIPKSQDTTAYLKNKLYETVSNDDVYRHSSLKWPLSTAPEKVGLKKAIVDGLENLNSKAVTFAAFKPYATPCPLITGGIRKIISCEYTRCYCEHMHSDIVTGIRGIEHYDFIARRFPVLDYGLLRTICRHLVSNFDDVIANTDLFLNLIAPKEDETQKAFSNNCSLLLRAILRMKYTAGHHNNMSVAKNEIAAELDNMSWKGLVLDLGNCDSLYLKLSHNLMNSINIKASSNPFFQECLDMERKEQSKGPTRVLLCTATDNEDDALQAIMKKGGYTSSVSPQKTGCYLQYTLSDRLLVFHMRSRMGSVGPNSSELSVSDAIDDLHPEYVLGCGIAFGASAQKQAIGDVLVSEWVKFYEKQRVGENANIDRGEKIPASSKLLQMASIARLQIRALPWRVITGGLLSGEKLVDNEEFKGNLLSIEKEAIGGEMEAAGLVAACHRRNVPWILIKAICDWGEGKTSDAQIPAANNAMSFTLTILENCV